MEDLCQKILDQYLDRRRSELTPGGIKKFRWCIISLIEYLELYHPEVESFENLRRSPHIEGWMEWLASRQPPFKDSTRRLIIEHVRHFFKEIREWGWPEGPSTELFHCNDLPLRYQSFQPKKILKLLSKQIGISHKIIQRKPLYRIVEEHFGILNETQRPTSLYNSRTVINFFLKFLWTHFPDVDTLDKLQRVPHIEGWLQMLAKKKPPLKDLTFCNYLYVLRRFFEKIRMLKWPDKPPLGFIRPEDFPKSINTPRRRIWKILEGVSTELEKPFYQTLKRYLDIRRATLRHRTIVLYCTHILSIIDFLQKHFPEIDSFSNLQRAPHIEGWLQMLAKKKPPYRNRTRRKFIRDVRRFFNDIRDWNWPGFPVADLIYPEDFPPPEIYLPKPLPVDVDAALIEALRQDGGFLALGLLLARRTGLRRGELQRLELNCLIENPKGHSSMRVPIVKLRRERVIPIDAETVDLIKKIREIRGQRPATTDPETGRPLELLFCNDKGEFLYQHLFSRKLKSVAKAAGIKENVHLHRLRHTYATELIRNGVSLPGVMKLLGHKNIKMTLCYVEVTNEDLGRDYLKAIERARHHYDRLKTVDSYNSGEQQDPIGALRASFDHLVARIQSIRFDHTDSNRRKRYQRLIERIRRVQGELPELME